MGGESWIQGFSPKEHWEMIQEKDRLEWQAKREEADRAYQRERDDSQQRFQADEARKSRKHERDSLWTSIAAVVAAILGSFLSAGVAYHGITRPPQPIPLTVTVAQQPAPPQPSPPPATINVVYPQPEPLLPKLLDELKEYLQPTP